MYTYRFIFILITELVRLVITSRFVPCFLAPSESRFFSLLSYAGSLFLTSIAYIFFNLAWLNLASTALGLILISAAYSGSLKKRAQFVLFVLSISCIIDLSVYSLLGPTFDYEDYSESASILSLLLLLAAQLIARRILPDSNERELTNRYWWRYSITLIICITVSLVLYTDRTISPMSLLIVCGGFLAVNLVMQYMLDGLAAASVNETENLALKDQMRGYEREISLQEMNQERMRAFRHDIKHHLAEIKALAERGETDMIAGYIRNMEDTVNESEQLCNSGNIVIDTIINFMLAKAQDKNIHVNTKIAVPKDIDISAFDMNIILGNLLENAIEANSLVQEPRIDLKILYMNESLLIEIDNTYSNQIIVKNNHLASSKFPADGHGYGIRNVRKIVDKYTNSFDLRWDDTIFSVKILIKL